MWQAASACHRARGGVASRIVIEIRPKPPLDFLERHSLAQVIVKHLIAADFADGKIFRLRMRKIESADTAAGPHCKILREDDPGVFLHIEEFPEQALLRMVGASRVSGGGTNPAILFID